MLFIHYVYIDYISFVIMESNQKTIDKPRYSLPGTAQKYSFLSTVFIVQHFIIIYNLLIYGRDALYTVRYMSSVANQVRYIGVLSHCL